MTGSVIAQIWPLFIVALFVVIVRWHRRRVPDWGDVPDGVALERELDGAVIVPVSQLIHRRVWGHTTNGISPKLWLTHGVLSPEYNAAHRDHFHFDRGPYRACR